MVTSRRRPPTPRRRWGLVAAGLVALLVALLVAAPTAPPASAAAPSAAAAAARPAAGAGRAASATGPVVPARLPAGLLVPQGAPALPNDLTATSWLVADLDTGAVLAAKDAHAPLAPASTLKVLTALSLLPVVPPDRVVVPTQGQVNVDGSKVGLLPGVPYPAEELYTALLLVSGNDAANALAGAAGGPEVSVQRMNDEAQRLGAVDTHAANPHGLDAPGQVSTAYDLAVLGRAALQTPDIARWAAIRRTAMIRAPGAPTYEIDNHNRLLGSYPGAIGLKNGYTVAAQASYVGAAERGGHRLVVTLMRDKPNFWGEARALLDWGFADVSTGVAPVGRLPAAASAALPLTHSAPARGRPVPVAGPAASSASPGLGLPGRELAGALLVLATAVAVRPRRRRRLADRP